MERPVSRGTQQAFDAQMEQHTNQMRRQAHEAKSVKWLFKGYTTNFTVKMATLNRTPVWDDKKKARYILALMEGKVTPPLFLNYVEDTFIIYDGGNRFHAIFGFINGEFSIQLKNGMRAKYRLKEDDNTRNVFELSQKHKDHFDDVNLDLYIWNNLDEGTACELALNMNQGTPMNVPERLKLELSCETECARLARRVYEHPVLVSLREVIPREGLLKAVILCIRELISGENLPLNGERRPSPHFETLSNFLRSTAPIEDKDTIAHILTSAAERTLRLEHRTLDAFYTEAEAVRREQPSQRESFLQLKAAVATKKIRIVVDLNEIRRLWKNAPVDCELVQWLDENAETTLTRHLEKEGFRRHLFWWHRTYAQRQKRKRWV